MIALVAATAAGRRTARALAERWPDARYYEGPVTETLPAAFADCAGVVAFLAVGATVRLLAPLLVDKRRDPGVVCVDEAGRHAVALVGGHAGGANALAARVAASLGCTPVVTTGAEVAGVPGLDELAVTMGWRIDPVSRLAQVGGALLSGGPVALVSERCWPLPALPEGVTPVSAPDHRGLVGPAIVISDRVLPGAPLSPEALPVPTDNSPTDNSPTDNRENRPEDNRPERGGTKSSAHKETKETQLSKHRGTKSSEGRDLVVYRPSSLVVGLGAARGVSAAEILALIDAALAEAGLSPLSVARLASVEIKADEAGLLAAAAERGWPVSFHSVAALRSVPVPHPSPVVDAEVGTPSVAEAAALLGEGPGVGRAGRTGGGAELVVPKRKSGMATVAVARHPPRGRLALVGLGPGARDLLTPRAVAELHRASVVVGLDQYVDSVRDLLRPGTRTLTSGLGQEQVRAEAAVAQARAGHAVALVGSGDAGVYAMASPALAAADEDIDVVGVPGVTAALAAAALLGAPLGHDHVSISLSDLHTSWEAIERRVRAAAAGDFVVCFYNPRSRARDWQLGNAVAILGAHRSPATPVGLVRNANRPDQNVVLTSLGEVRVHLGTVDMSTVVLVGSSTTRLVGGRMVTPRGYRWTP